MKTRMLSFALCLGLLACGKDDKAEAAKAGATTAGGEQAEPTLCMAADDKHETSEYDTSGDGKADVRKVFLRVGDDALARLVLVCRENDVNGDGEKDVVRFYTDEGEPQRDLADENFDGKIDSTTYFENGVLVRQELDTDFDGDVDQKVFFEKGIPLRTERDIAGRSTPQKWQPDRWEYIEEGRLVRMGTDVDGDGKVDRWDRDAAIKKAPPVNPNGLSG